MIKFRSQQGGSQLAEFGPVLFVFLLMVLFPLINLIGFTCGSATAWLIARECASTAANSIDFDSALLAADQQCTNLTTSGFGKFAQLQPLKPGRSGVNIWVQSIDATTGAITATYPKNQGALPPIDTTKNIYEYVAQVEFKVGPFLNMSGVPFIGSIPIVGKPAEVNYITAQSAEYPDGVIGSGSPVGGAAGSGQPRSGRRPPPRGNKP